MSFIANLVHRKEMNHLIKEYNEYYEVAQNIYIEVSVINTSVNIIFTRKMMEAVDALPVKFTGLQGKVTLERVLKGVTVVGLGFAGTGLTTVSGGALVLKGVIENAAVDAIQGGAAVGLAAVHTASKIIAIGSSILAAGAFALTAVSWVSFELYDWKKCIDTKKTLEKRIKELKTKINEYAVSYFKINNYVRGYNNATNSYELFSASVRTLSDLTSVCNITRENAKQLEEATKIFKTSLGESKVVFKEVKIQPKEDGSVLYKIGDLTWTSSREETENIEVTQLSS